MTCEDCCKVDVCVICKDCPDGTLAVVCDKFKDKNKIIELPCKVGDMVYIIPSLSNVFNEITAMKCIGFNIIGKSQNSAILRGKGVVFTYQPSFDMFGKTVFLSKAEAEKVLETQNG